MKKLKRILEEWDLPCGVGISMKMGVSGYDASLLPTSDNNGVLPVHRYNNLSEVRMSRDNLMLLGKLAFRRLSDGEAPTSEEVAEHQRLFAAQGPAAEQAGAARIPMEGVFAKALLQVKTEANIQEPVVIMMNSSLKGEMHLNLSVKKGAKAKIVIFSQLDVTSVQCVRLIQEAGSRLELVWIPLQTTPESYLALHAGLDHGAQLDLHQACLDENIYFSNRIEQHGDRSRVRTYASVLATGQEKMVVNTAIRDLAKDSLSRIHCRAVLDGEAALGCYGGQIAERGSVHGDAYQESCILCLDERVKIKAQPRALMDFQETRAASSSSVRCLDEEELFYLESRGVTRKTAQGFMAQAFLKPSFEAITIEPVRNHLFDKALKKIERS